MVFADLNFIFLFFPAFLAVYFALPFRYYRNVVLFLFSLFFYAWGEPVYVFLMMFSLWFNFTVALGIERSAAGRKAWFMTGVALNVLLLAVFKYLDFIIINLNKIPGCHLALANLPLPIGVSFYTFQLISYIADVYRGASKADKSYMSLGAYLAGFPQLVAGPIVRYQTIADALKDRRENWGDFIYGTRRFMVGLAKKVLIANNMAFVVDSLLKESPLNYGAWGAWLVLAAYALQIYYDFSGYSDMAIGIGRMLGFHFLENFNYPYVARTITEYWRRWHISLTTFFRDYIYIPLGGNRVPQGRWLVNVLFIWALTGLWHGAQWNYVIWGMYYGVILIAEKLLLRRWLEKIPGMMAHAYVVFFVLLGWAFFRLEDPVMLREFLPALFGAYGSGKLITFVYCQVLQAHIIAAFAAGIIFCAPLAPRMERYFYARSWGGWLADLWLLALFAASVFLLIAGSYNPFIYFRF